jgi:acetate kinase
MAGMSATSRKDAILVLNSGSSSLKFGLFAPGSADEQWVLSGSAEGVGHQNGSLHVRAADGTLLVRQDSVLVSQPESLRALASALKGYVDQEPIAVGHRIVHGGPRLTEHQLLTQDVLEQLRAAVHFAPLHIPPALALVGEAQHIFPGSLHFACFDTAFHRTLPEIARHLALPKRYFDQGVMRYGFHGLAYESVVYRLGADLPKRAILAHLGNGASVCAVEEGKSIDTSMALTPTAGLPMGTRSGDLDPGVLLYLLRTEELDATQLEDLFNKRSGLAGLSGGESDMQELLRRASSGDAAAKLAIDIFCAAVRKYIGAYAAVLGGVDLLIFSGGIGEHSAVIRERIGQGLAFLGLENKTRVMPAEEEVQIARHCRRLLRGHEAIPKA